MRTSLSAFRVHPVTQSAYHDRPVNDSIHSDQLVFRCFLIAPWYVFRSHPINFDRCLLLTGCSMLTPLFVISKQYSATSHRTIFAPSASTLTAPSDIFVMVVTAGAAALVRCSILVRCPVSLLAHTTLSLSGNQGTQVPLCFYRVVHSNCNLKSRLFPFHSAAWHESEP